jgi:FkbM family methyltransferase
MQDELMAVLRLLRSRGPESNISKRWLFQNSSRLDRKFRNSGAYTFGDRGEFAQVTIDNQVYLWPRSASRDMILQILSELLTPTHPHQYQYGPTIIRPDDIVLDIGACEDSFSALVTSRCKRVVAIEPSVSMCRLIEELFQLRNEPCPQILPCLLGSQSGKAYFLDNVRNPGASKVTSESVPGAYEVPVRTIDEVIEMLPERPTYLKCDAEGEELKIFAGGKSFLRKFHPRLAITTYHNVGDYADMHNLLKSLGYRVTGKGFLFSEGTLRPIMIHAW